MTAAPPGGGGTGIASDRTREAISTLTAALARLEAAADTHASALERQSAHADAMARMERDRADLAETLHDMTAKASRLETANRAVEARLVRLMSHLRQGEP
ncbi:MAG: DUF4164 family protein [Pseudomonadota bacterium]